MKRSVLLLLAAACSIALSAQPDRWQQHVKYTMNINMDVTTNRFAGTQKLEYTNNSPDTLNTVFYHLYWNAFQPNSMMDTRSRELGKIILGKDRNGRDVHDWDDRVRDRILHLQPDQIGYQKIVSLTMNGIAQPFKTEETVLQVKLTRPLLPRATAVFDMTFEAQVPLQIRRSGRDNPNTGVKYSMSQWYPKMCEYDYEGWHPTPYVAREFYGVWGDYDVTISIDKSFTLGGTGYLQNPDEIGYGYEAPGKAVTRPAGNKLTWHFIAPNVHDFMWAADAQYAHLVRQAAGGITINVLYNRDPVLFRARFDTMSAAVKAGYNNSFSGYMKSIDDDWRKLADAAVLVLPFIEQHFGDYPYKQYSFVHGGDGGMEYPMATLVNGPSLGNAFHEWMHSWYQGMLGTNESVYPWMDEGFTSYAEYLVSQYYRQQTNQLVVEKETGAEPRMLPVADSPDDNPHIKAYVNYYNLTRSGFEEPMTTHADHYNTNYAYGQEAYTKGQVFLEQLGYITGAQVRDKILLEYYRQWRFKHPNVNDFIRVAEKVSDMKLDWYREYWVNTTKTINYGIDSLWEAGGKSYIRLKNSGLMPMPVDLQLTYKDGSKELHYVPMYLMFGEKPVEFPDIHRTVHEPWKWTHPTYVVETSRSLKDVTAVEIDPTQRMADVDRSDNKLEVK